MNISDNCVVSFDYTLSNDAGEVIDSSEGAQPLVYLHSAGNIIPGLEREMADKVSGEAFKVSVAAGDAYGEINPDLIQQVPLSAFPVEDVAPGMRFEAGGEGGSRYDIMVTDVSDDTVTVDGNHPLAGQKLHFDVEIVDVRQATEEEIAHGHPHGPGGAEH